LSQLPGSDPRGRPFTPEDLDKTVIAIPLLRKLRDEMPVKKGGRGMAPRIHPIVIDLNLKYEGGVEQSRSRAESLIDDAIKAVGKTSLEQQGINKAKSDLSAQYLFASLEGAVIQELVRLDEKALGKRKGIAAHRSIFRIWPDFNLKSLITKSVSTVKADAAKASFAAFGEGIVWAVMDSGISGDHPHFVRHRNLDLDAPLQHRDFTGTGAQAERPLEDSYGHGTHVAGIIAGELRASKTQKVRAFSRSRDEVGDINYDPVEIDAIAGMAPKCKLVSLKVLDGSGDGLASNVIAAIAYVQKINSFGRRIRIHGVNLSVGYDFEPEWFACGQSPLCVEVDQLVKSGVVVVVAAGNTGYGWNQSEFKGSVPAGMDLSINDPGNADKAITVGSTHRDMPHVYGVSYFSSKGPTGDGRLKPDLVAPGEKILSCASGENLEKAKAKFGTCEYVEDSGTSMAAPHVSGVIAAFLSIRNEFIGRAEEVKQIFVSTATDLKRDRTFQGGGLVDLMRAIQSV
jgi:serine protease AprX